MKGDGGGLAAITEGDGHGSCGSSMNSGFGEEAGVAGGILILEKTFRINASVQD